MTNYPFLKQLLIYNYYFMLNLREKKNRGVSAKTFKYDF